VRPPSRGCLARCQGGQHTAIWADMQASATLHSLAVTWLWEIHSRCWSATLVCLAVVEMRCLAYQTVVWDNPLCAFGCSGSCLGHRVCPVRAWWASSWVWAWVCAAHGHSEGPGGADCGGGEGHPPCLGHHPCTPTGEVANKAFGSQTGCYHPHFGCAHYTLKKSYISAQSTCCFVLPPAYATAGSGCLSCRGRARA
jgi:hypothetical protein